jgi:hypothetical protein
MSNMAAIRWRSLLRADQGLEMTVYNAAANEYR